LRVAFTHAFRRNGLGKIMALAVTFPGQGSQQVGMGKALAEAFPQAQAVFD
jgi:acyl transferase domain-containing protein